MPVSDESCVDRHVGKPVRQGSDRIVDFRTRRILPTGLASAMPLRGILFHVQNLDRCPVFKLSSEN